jgi:glutathione peroxidase
MGMRLLFGLGITALALAGAVASAGTTGSTGSAPPEGGFRFASIDGGEIDLAAYRGQPVLVVNTASRCAFTPQYDALQALWDEYRDRGLVVLGVPSDSFNQELASAEAVKDFCEVNFSIDFPMTEITPVTGAGAHPFYRWAADAGVKPRWNFHKILLDGQGAIAASFGTNTKPTAPAVREAIEALLPAS